MATTTASFHPSASLRAAQLFSTFCGAVKHAFEQPASPQAAGVAKTEAGSDVWKLYSMSRGRDSVSPAVVAKLAQVAAAK